MRRRAWLVIVAGTLVAMVTGTVPAGAERAQQGDVIVMINGGIQPRNLPRRNPEPVAVFLSGGVRTADGSGIPRVNWIRLELAWRGVMNTKGLPVCPRKRIASTVSRQALALCGNALVGRGKLQAHIYVPNQAPFAVNANMLAFNGKTKAGRPAVWAHAYSTDPPTSFVIPFTVKHEPSKTILVTTIRRSLGPWPHVSNFQIRVSRRFRYRGKMQSYLNASCPVPKAFTAGFLSFARATYSFAGGEQIVTESVRSCRVRQNDAE